MLEAKELPFPLDEYRQRLKKVRARMVEEELDLLLVHNLADQFYLTGYQSFDQEVLHPGETTFEVIFAPPFN